MATLFPPKQKLHHATPSWVPSGAVFHIRIRADFANLVPLTNEKMSTALLESARFYHTSGRWFIHLWLLMPDHLHALLTFPPAPAHPMARTLGDWKKYQTRERGVRWQDGFFDHRIRNSHEFEEKSAYIWQNPVVKFFCGASEAWPWVIDATNRGAAPAGEL